MEIHRFEKLWFGASLLLIVVLIATIVYGAVGPGVAMVDDSGGIVDPSALTDSENFREPGVYEADDGGYDVYVRAQQFAFQPGTNSPIRVPADTDVTFYVSSPDVTHGFNLAGTNVNTMVIPGQVAEVTVNFDEPGTYHIVCNEYCGAAHHTMRGTVEVVPRDQFDMESQEVTDQ
ncbi:cytochrome c oxidase subunit II [Halobellus rubicundus]|uniref:Cytochrome c oxidase subunit II n=1 Tax=Halobellus rubicundus TaxID=2996466 RepID=A0ABD5MB96_9EURY